MRGEGERNGRSGPPSEHIRVVVVSATDTVERADMAVSGWLYLLRVHGEDSLAARMRGERMSQAWSTRTGVLACLGASGGCLCLGSVALLVDACDGP